MATVKARVSISKCRVRGRPFWRVRWHNAGRVHRKFFSGRAAAEAHAAARRGEAVGVRQLLMAIPQADQEKLVMLFNEAQRRGIDLLALLAAPPVAEVSSPPALADVLDEMEVTKRKAGRAQDYLNSLHQIVSAFGHGRERMAINLFTVRDVERFLDSKNLASRATLRARLSTLFKFAMRRGYRADNPCNQLEAVSRPHAPPTVLSLDETKCCLKWLLKHPRSLGWFVLSTFAGLRPEEAEKTHWSEINFAEGWIRVEAQTSKVRQRRVVYPPSMAFTWLQVAKRLKSALPLKREDRRDDRVQLRKVLGWIIWKQDVTRHTAASNWLAVCGAAATVAHALGNSEAVLKKDYMALVTKAEAELFWRILPNKFTNSFAAAHGSKGCCQR